MKDPFLRILTAFLAILWLSASPATARAPIPPQEVETIPHVIMVDLGSGQVLYSKDADSPFLPASMTKVMTAFVAFEEIDAGRLSLDRVIKVRPETSRLWGGRGTTMFLEPGETVRVRDLLLGILTASANDASIALAEGVVGSERAYTDMMNHAAGQLGMRASHFNTVNGWPDEGQTFVSARDLTILAAAMIRKHPGLYHQFAGHKVFLWKEYILRSRNPIVGKVAGADGIKTGYTREAGYNFLGSAERNGRRIIFVVGGASRPYERNAASKALLEWGYTAWRNRPLFGAGEPVASIAVQGGNAREIELVNSGPIYASLPADSTAPVSLRIEYSGPIQAPITKGQQVAELIVDVEGLPQGRVPLYSNREVRRATPMDRLLNGFMKLFS